MEHLLSVLDGESEIDNFKMEQHCTVQIVITVILL